MSKRQKQVDYIECDGCGYTINTDVRHTKLELGWINESDKSNGMIPLHFHAEGKYDCLRYFMGSAAKQEKVLHSHSKISSVKFVNLILKTLSHRKAA